MKKITCTLLMLALPLTGNIACSNQFKSNDLSDLSSIGKVQVLSADRANGSVPAATQLIAAYDPQCVNPNSLNDDDIEIATYQTDQQTSLQDLAAQAEADPCVRAVGVRALAQISCVTINGVRQCRTGNGSNSVSISSSGTARPAPAAAPARTTTTARSCVTINGKRLCTSGSKSKVSCRATSAGVKCYVNGIAI